MQGKGRPKHWNRKIWCRCKQETAWRRKGSVLKNKQREEREALNIVKFNYIVRRFSGK